MQTNVWVLLGCVSLCSAPVFAQSQVGSSSSSQDVPASGYIRRFSVGGTLGVLGFQFIPNKTGGTTVGSIVTSYSTTNSSQRIGYGITGQVALTEHFAISASALFRRVGYQMTTVVQTGTTTVTTTSAHSDTRATAYEFPLSFRYYVKGRHQKGPHFFMEGGVALMKAANVRTSIDTTNASGTNSCCVTSTNSNLANRNVRGFLGGMGLQLIDPIGIRVVPEVRYTRWMDNMFYFQSTITQRNQIEAVISLSW